MKSEKSIQKQKILIYLIFFLMLNVSYLTGQTVSWPASWRLWRPYDVYRCGAKGLAMGGAFTAVADDVSAMYFNPAGLIHINEISIFYTFDSQIKFDGYIDPRLKLNFQVPPLLGIVIPISNKSRMRFGLGLTVPFQRKIPDDFAVYKLAPYFAMKILNTLAFGINIGFNYSTYAGARRSDGWGWSYQVGLLYLPSKKIHFGLNYQSKIPIYWDRHSLDEDVNETFPDILSGGMALAVNPKFIASFDLEFQNWKSMEYIINGHNYVPVDQLETGLFKTIHPHLGTMFLIESWGVHARLGLYTDSFIQENIRTIENETQVLWSFGLGVYAYREIGKNEETGEKIEKKTLTIEAAISDSYLTSFIFKDNNQIITLQITADYKF